MKPTLEAWIKLCKNGEVSFESHEVTVGGNPSVKTQMLFSQGEQYGLGSLSSKRVLEVPGFEGVSLDEEEYRLALDHFEALETRYEHSVAESAARLVTEILNRA